MLAASVPCLVNATAFAQTRPPSPFDIELLISRSLAPGLRADAFVQQMQPMFSLLDANGDGVISDDDRQIQLRKVEAGRRTLLISQFVSADFNDDGVVTREEMVLYQRYVGSFSARRDGDAAQASREELLERRVAMFMRADADADGRIDWDEMVAYAKRSALPTPWEVDYDTPYKTMLSFDANGDGKTTREEYTEAMRRRFAEMDSDGDDLISQAEFDGYWQRKGVPAPKVAAIQPSYEEKLAAECAPPRPAKDAKLIVFNGHQFAALSSVAIGSQDAVTMTAKVVIESGTQPLYLVIIGWQRAIWQFEGAVERVQHLVLGGITPARGPGVPAGAVGIAKDRISFADAGKCGTFWVNMNQRYPDLVRERGKLLFGRAPDALLQAAELGTLHLPSGQVTPRPEKAVWSKTIQFDESNAELGLMRRVVLRFYPGGVVDFAPESVVAGQAVALYEVLPEAAGLLQLTIQGALVRNAKGEYVVQRPMRFPAGLAGGHAVRFLVPKGVPRPTGDPGHSRVVIEDAAPAKP